MYLFDRFFKLAHIFGSLERGARAVVSLEQLSELWYCTPRNVKFIIRQLSDSEWITWRPGRGRGNRSSMELLVSSDDLVLNLAQEAAEEGRLADTASLFDQHGAGHDARRRFADWLDRQFGYHTESGTSGQTDTLRLPFYRMMPNLEPISAIRRTECHMARQIFDTLVRRDSNTGEFLPHLSYHWETDANRRIWTFYLRKGVLFHDKSELTSEDVQVTLERLTRYGSYKGSRDWLATEWTDLPIKQIEPLGRYALRISLSCASEMLLHYLSSPKAGIQPRSGLTGRSVETSDPGFGRRLPIGTGPFRVTRNDESMIVLEAFRAYFAGRAHLDRVEMWIMPELNDSDVHVKEIAGAPLPYLHPFQFHEPDPKNFPVIEQLEPGCAFITFNQRKDNPLNSPELRRWLRERLDSTRLIRELGGRRTLTSRSFFPRRSLEAALNPITITGSQNVETAETTFASGSDDSFDTSYAYQALNGHANDQLAASPPPFVPQQPLRLLTYRILNASLEQNARWIKKQCSAFGIAIEVIILEYEELLQPDVIDQADMILANAIVDDDVEMSFLRLMLDERSLVRRHLPDRICLRIREFITDMQRESSASRRKEIVHDAERLLYDDCSLLFLYHLKQTSYYHPMLLGVRLNPYGWVDFRDLALKPSSV